MLCVMQSNRLESMRGFEACTALEELYLSHNGIWQIEVRLQELNFNYNGIWHVEVCLWGCASATATRD